MVALGRGSYELTGSAKTATITAVDGEQAVVTVSVNGTPITLTIGEGASVTYTEVSANGKVTGLTGIRRTGTVGVRADGMPATACVGIAIQNVLVATTGNDQISGTGGDDTVNAGVGNNTVTTGGGDDSITTGSSNEGVDCGAGGGRGRDHSD